MKNLLAIATLIIASTLTAFAQNSKAEQEVLKLDAEYIQAQINRDIAFYERVLADNYIYAGERGQTRNKAQTLEMFRKEKEMPPYIIALKTEDVKAKVMGNTALLTGAWIITESSISDKKAEPQTYKGRYTSVLEKRNGRWMYVAEHVSEAPNDRKLMEQQVLKAGREYNELMKRLKSGKPYEELVKSGDIAALDRLLVDEYIYTSRDGVASGKKESFEEYKNNKISSYSADMLNQEVRVIGNNAAVETGTIHYKGINSGKPFDIIKRYTTTWVWRNGRWQIVADHTSAVKQ